MQEHSTTQPTSSVASLSLSVVSTHPPAANIPLFSQSTDTVTAHAPSLKKLDPTCADEIRSTVEINSLPVAVLQCIFNSIDASASTVEVSLAPSYNSFEVRDDGCGITPDQMKLVGERYGIELARLVTNYCSNLQRERCLDVWVSWRSTCQFS